MMKETAKQRYEKLQADRQHYLDRARECSELTIPTLIPDDGFESSSEIYTPFQSVGARGVNNLASKLLLLLLPPNSPFFRLSLSGKTKEELEQSPELQSEIDRMKSTLAWTWGRGDKNERGFVIKEVERQTGWQVEVEDLPEDLKPKDDTPKLLEDKNE